MAPMSATMNRSHNVLYARLVPGGNVLQSSPKGFFEADACPVTGDHDRPFNDRRFHRLFSPFGPTLRSSSTYVAGRPWFQADLSTADGSATVRDSKARAWAVPLLPPTDH